MRSKIPLREPTRLLVFVATLLLGLCLNACSVTGAAETRGKVKIPGMDPFTYVAKVGNDGSVKVDGGPGNAGLCLSVVFYDAKGNETGRLEMQLDGNGKASGSMPAGTARWQVEIVECDDTPPTKPHEVGPQQATTGASPGSLPGAAQAAPRRAIGRTYLLWGAPIVPDDSFGVQNLTYTFRVRAADADRARSLVQPLIAGGIGTPIPHSVEVLTFATVETALGGARYVQAMPGTFEALDFALNGGAFSTSLSSMLRYQVGEWDVAETMIPLSAFDFGFVPGATYSNAGAASFKTDRLAEPLAGEYGYSYTF